MNVSAVDKSTGRENKITITNDKVRLAKEIKQMVTQTQSFRTIFKIVSSICFCAKIFDAERYRLDDEKQRERVSAKNALESYCYTMKSTAEDENWKGKLADSFRNTVIDNCNATIKWLEANQLADKEEFEYKQNEVKQVCYPLCIKRRRM